MHSNALTMRRNALSLSQRKTSLELYRIHSLPTANQQVSYAPSCSLWPGSVRLFGSYQRLRLNPREENPRALAAHFSTFLYFLASIWTKNPNSCMLQGVQLDFDLRSWAVDLRTSEQSTSQMAQWIRIFVGNSCS